MKKVKEVVKGFTGQLRGDVAKEKWFTGLRTENKIKLPSIGNTNEHKLNANKLDGAMLSWLDGAGALTLDGKKVSKIKVYTGEIALPASFALTFVVNRVSDVSCKLKATIVSKK